MKAVDIKEISSLKVLLVEDEKFIRSIIVKLLRQFGLYTIYEAQDGISGLQELVRMRPDFVICDIHMKPMDGMTFLAKVRSAPIDRIRQTPIVFLTADSSATMVNKAKEQMADGFIVKPVSYAALEARLTPLVQEILDEKKKEPVG